MNLDFLHSTLIIVDIQRDFCPGGALPVKDGELVIEPINHLSALFSARSGTVCATQDWHPLNHISFASSHANRKPGETIDTPLVKDLMLWPDHCIKGKAGAEFCEGLDLEPVNFIIRKGFHAGLDSYSAFFENDRTTPTGLDGLLKALSISTVVLGGLATDYCVYYSAMDSKNLGYTTIVVKDAVQGVDYPPGSVEKAISSLENAGVIIISSGDLR